MDDVSPEIERRRQNQRRYYQRHKDAIRAACNERYKTDPSRREYMRVYHEANREKKHAYNTATRAHQREKNRQWRAANRERVNARARLWLKRNKEKQRGYHLKYDYRLTPERYLQMFGAQNGLCAICQQPPSSKRPLHVDHNHETNQIRGLLCTRCNPMIGYAGESTERLRAAIEYLNKWGN